MTKDYLLNVSQMMRVAYEVNPQDIDNPEKRETVERFQARVRAYIKAQTAETGVAPSVSSAIDQVVNMEEARACMRRGDLGGVLRLLRDGTSQPS